MSIDLDSKYSALIDELQALTAKFSVFLNGPADQVITTDSGPIKTLAGVIADLKKYQYVQKVVDHKTYGDMTQDSTIEPGLLIRVWGDTTELNGLYQKNNDNTFTKLAYQGLVDLLP